MYRALLSGCDKSRTEAGHRVLSSISRLFQHRVTPAGVSDAKGLVRRPSGGPEIDVTVAASAHSNRGVARNREEFWIMRLIYLRSVRGNQTHRQHMT